LVWGWLMARKILLIDPKGAHELGEVAASDEAELQERVKSSPELLPIEDFGMVGPLLVIGRETTLPSGAVDLVGLARGGELLIVEFKTGPQNPDFRRATSQLVD
jgi:RecB family endonuclease NucS